MTKQCYALLCVFLLLSGSPIQASRIASVENHMLTDTIVDTETITDTQAMAWGRSCESLQTRFQNQQTRMVQSEGMRSVLVTVSFLRTLRRANARSCDWMQDPNLDVSALTQVASTQLRQSRCYDAATATIQVAQDLPEEEREAIARNAMLILLSDSEDCSITEESEEFNSESEDEMEEEMDEETDLIFDSLSEEGSTSFLQEGQSPFSNTVMPFVLRIGRMVGGYRGGDVALFVGIFILMIIWGIFCGYLMEFIRRALRWIRCSISGGDETCFGAPPAAWFRHVVRGGCVAIGAFMGFGDAMGWAFAN